MAKKQQAQATNVTNTNNVFNASVKVSEAEYQQFTKQQQAEYLTTQALLTITEPTVAVAKGVVSVAGNVVVNVAGSIADVVAADQVGTVVDRIKVGMSSAMNTIKREQVKYLLETDELMTRLNAENEALSTSVKALREKRASKKPLFSMFTK